MGWDARNRIAADLPPGLEHAPIIQIPQRVQFSPVAVADTIAASVQIGGPFPIGAREDGEPLMLALPDFAALHVEMTAKAEAPISDDDADRLALVAALGEYQRATGAVFARFKARHSKPEEPPAPVLEGS